MWLIGGVILAGIIGGIVYLFNEIQEKDARIDALSEQCREKDSEIQSLNKKCNTLTEECWQRDETIKALRDEIVFLNNEIINKYNPQWRFRNIFADLADKAHRVNINDM